MQYTLAQYKKIDEARKEMLRQLNEGERDWTNTACLVAAFADKAPKVSGNQACHAGLNSADMKGSIAIVSGLMKPNKYEGMLDEDEAYIFLDWLLNRSPYASTFISKDAYECLLAKTTVSNSFTPSNLMAAGMVASRRLWEYPVVARVMVDLIKAGVKENLAFFIGHITNVSFDRKGNVSLNGVKGGHCSIDTGSFCGKSLLNFINAKPLNLNPLYHDQTYYNGYGKMYCEGAYPQVSIGCWIHNNFPYAGKKEEGANPFGKALIAPGKSCSYDHFIETMKTFQHTIMAYITDEAKKAA